VLTAVDFYDELAIQANEIQDVVAIRMLSAELASFELSPFQSIPECALRIGSSVAEPLLQLRSEDVVVGLAFHVRVDAKLKPIPTQPSP